MEISGFVKLSTIDFPGILSAVIFTQGCNLDCIFCHNRHLIPIEKGKIMEEEVLSYLFRARDMIDGVVITGGEPLLQSDIENFAEKIKEIGLKVKIDTNGFFPEKLESLLSKSLVDFVALDVKAPLIPEDYSYIAGKIITEGDLEKLRKTIELVSGSVKHEFRTTVLESFHTPEKILAIAKELPASSTYVLQQFISREGIPVSEHTTRREYLEFLVHKISGVRSGKTVLRVYE